MSEDGASRKIQLTKHYTPAQEWPLVSVVILNFNGNRYVCDCVASVLQTSYPHFEILLVDNASTDDSPEILARLFGHDSRLKLIRNAINLLYAEGNNIGIRRAQGEYVVVLNSDTEVDLAWLTTLVKVMQDPQIGAAQPKILLYDEPYRIDNAGGLLDRFGYSKGKDRRCLDEDVDKPGRMEEVFFASGTAIILRRALLDEVGLFDPEFYAYSEDVDLCWRIRLKAYKVVCVHDAIVYHKVSRTISRSSLRLQLVRHGRKNRLATLIKNYSLPNLFLALPGILIFSGMIFLKELIFDRAVQLSLTTISAILWNLLNIKYLLEKRAIVQRQIRRVPDSEIIRHMSKGSFVVEELLTLMFNRQQVPGTNQK